MLDTLQEKTEQEEERQKQKQKEQKRSLEMKQTRNRLKVEDTQRRLEFVKNADLSEKKRLTDKLYRIEQ
jgi:hypothetical protein